MTSTLRSTQRCRATAPVLPPLLLVAALLLLSAWALAAVEGALLHAFTDESPSVCFVETVQEPEVAAATSDPAEALRERPSKQYVVGSYQWMKHERNRDVRFSLELRDESGNTLMQVPMRSSVNLKTEAGDDGAASERSVPFAFEVDVPVEDGADGGAAARTYYLCAVLDSQVGILASKPIYIAFDVDQQSATLALQADKEEVAAALRRRRRGTDDGAHANAITPDSAREDVGSGEVFVFQDFGGQLKSIVQPRAYLTSVERELNQLGIDTKRKAGLMEQTIEKEGRMRSTTESTFSRVWTCAVLVILVTLLVVSWQYSLLKTTLKRKKKI